jgi:quercetin dioxygenase-like cupin family protein
MYSLTVCQIIDVLFLLFITTYNNLTKIMAIDLYKGFTNTITGERFQCLSYDEDAFVFEWTVQPNGYVPFEHIHLKQDEVFHVKKGELRVLINGKVHIAGPGVTLTVPAGQRHIAFNNTAGLLQCVVEYRPGLDNYTFFQCFGGLTIDNDINEKGSINIPKMLYFTKKMKAKCITRPTNIPAPFFKLAITLFFLMGMVLGWQKLYFKYTKNK